MSLQAMPFQVRDTRRDSVMLRLFRLLSIFNIMSLQKTSSGSCNNSSASSSPSLSFSFLFSRFLFFLVFIFVFLSSKTTPFSRSSISRSSILLGSDTTGWANEKKKWEPRKEVIAIIMLQITSKYKKYVNTKIPLFIYFLNCLQ